jgi:hypothetical protein
MSEEKVVSIDQNYSDKLADKGLWNPELIAEITYITGCGKVIADSQGDKHFLEWLTNSGREEVTIEINDGNEPNKMMVNMDRFRTQRDELALIAVALKNGIEHVESKDE